MMISSSNSAEAFNLNNLNLRQLNNSEVVLNNEFQSRLMNTHNLDSLYGKRAQHDDTLNEQYFIFDNNTR